MDLATVHWLKKTNPLFLIILISDYGVEQIVVLQAVHARFVHDAIEVEGRHVKDGPVEGSRRIEIVIGGGVGRAREAPPVSRRVRDW